MVRLAILFILLTTALSCAPRERTRLEKQRQTSIQSFQPISYRRAAGPTPGLAEDRITITQTGQITAAGPSFGASTGQLSEFQRMQLATLFDNWFQLADAYPAPEGARPAAIVEIQFGPKKVTASDAAPNLPEPFTTIRRKLENLTRDLPAAKP
jgi:hypothetical protein